MRGCVLLWRGARCAHARDVLDAHALFCRDVSGGHAYGHVNDESDDEIANDAPLHDANGANVANDGDGRHHGRGRDRPRDESLPMQLLCFCAGPRSLLGPHPLAS